MCKDTRKYGTCEVCKKEEQTVCVFGKYRCLECLKEYLRQASQKDEHRQDRYEMWMNEERFGD